MTSLTFSKLIPSSQESGWPLQTLDPKPRATTFWILTFRIAPAGRSLSFGQPAWTSLRFLMSKWKGSPSPH